MWEGIGEDSKGGRDGGREGGREEVSSECKVVNGSKCVHCV